MVEPCAGGSGAFTRWGIVSSPIIHNPQLSISARFLYTSMTTLASVRGEVELCQETMARNIGRSRAWVNAAANELERFGLVRVQRVFVDGLQRPSRYVLLDGLRQPSADLPEHPKGKSAKEHCSERDAAASGPVGETTSHAVESPADSGDTQTEHRCQSADTSHESQIHITLSPVRARACLSSDQSSGPNPGIAPDWRPSDADVAWARARHPRLDVEAFTEHFVLACQAKGYRYADPGAGWRLWISDPKSPLPLIQSAAARSQPAQPITLSGETDHVSGHTRSSDHEFSGGNSSGWKTFRDDGRAGRKTFSGGAGGSAVDLAAVNASRAHAVLERLLGRRTYGPVA